MSKKDAANYISISREFIYSPETMQRYRVDKSDFTRRRKLPFEIVVLSMLKLLRKSLALELHQIFSDLNLRIKKVSASAFVQSRKKIKPELFYDLQSLIAREFYKDNDENVKLYKGMRLLSIDGSTITLPFSASMAERFGIYHNQRETEDVIIGRVSVLYDVLNEIVIDGLLRPFSEGEATLARQHIGYLSKGDLVIMDRAYPSFETAYLLQQQRVHFLFRCKENFSNEIKKFCLSTKTDQVVEIKAKQNRSFTGLLYSKDSTLSVRLLKIKLESGETEILMTSLLDIKEYPLKEFKALYNHRWGVETFYDRFKNIISVESFSGTSFEFIQQEFNCALYMSNMQTILTQDAQNEAIEKSEDKQYEYKVNKSLSLSFIRDKLFILYTSKESNDKVLEELRSLFTQHVIPIRPGRKYIRDIKKFRGRIKPKQFKNRRLIF